MNKFEQISGSRFVLLARQLLILATLGQTCDVTFFKNRPAVDVTVDEQLALAVMAGCSGPETLYEILQGIGLSNGTTVNIRDIWTINAMPKGGFTKEELEAVNMSQAEEKIGPNGATLRKMIKDTYHCKTRNEEDYYLRRFIAS